MRTLNARLLVVLLLIVGVVGVAAYFLHGYQLRRNADVLLREANAAKAREDLNLAADFLQRYVALVPQGSLDSLAELGLMLADMQRTGDAYQTLERVLRQDPGRRKVRRRLVDVAMQMQRYADAARHLDALRNDAPHDVELIALLAFCKVELNERDEAAHLYRQAIDLAWEHDPEHLEVLYHRLAELTHGPMEDPLAAVALLEELVAKLPKSAKARIVRGAFWLDHAAEIERAWSRNPPATDAPPPLTINRRATLPRPCAIPSTARFGTPKPRSNSIPRAKTCWSLRSAA